MSAASAMAMSGGCASHAAAVADPPPQSKEEIEFENSANRPPTARTLYEMGQMAAAEKKDDQAQVIFTKVVREHPDFLPAYCGLAEIQMRQRQIEEAMKTLNAGLQRSPKNAILINDLGMCQMVDRDFTAALASFTCASSLAPDVIRYRSNMAAALGMLGRYEESLAIYCQLMPASDAHFNLAVLCDARGDKILAARQYKMAEDLESKEPQP
jgi:serine/threonine-protein kinase